MVNALALLLGVALSAPPVSTELVQVAPAPPDARIPIRSPDRELAVVLVPGLKLQPFSEEKVGQPIFHSWQKPDSRMVQVLARHADVFAFAYSQNVPLDQIVRRSDLTRNIRWLRELGYRSIVLVGHSAGGLVARQLVEDHPDLGVCRVIQVCTPNAGSSWANIRPVHATQQIFVKSLTRERRRQMQQGRARVRIPGAVDFVCVVANGLGAGDGLVSLDSQWPEDLQEQGIPVYPLKTTHRSAVRGEAGVDLISRLVREPQPRWDSIQVERARRLIFGK